MAFDVTRQELLKQANDLLRLYKQTRDKKYKDEEIRLRKIASELESIVIGGGGGAQDLQSVTDEGNITTNGIEVEDLHVNGNFTNYNKNLPDIGQVQTSDARGYGLDYVAEKTLAYCRISSSAFDEEGAVRIKNNIFQTYIEGSWRDIPTGFRFRQDPDGNYEFEHKPTGFEWWIEVSSGNSDLLGLNGLPIVQNYAVSMGAYPVPLEIDGGTF